MDMREWSSGVVEYWSEGMGEDRSLKVKRLYTIITVAFCVLIAWSFLVPCSAEDVKRMTE
jgi:hypothetical protein